MPAKIPFYLSCLQIDFVLDNFSVGRHQQVNSEYKMYVENTYLA